MPDLLNFQVQVQSDVTVSVARVQVQAEVWDKEQTVKLADYTGPNRIQFVFRVQGWTVAQHRQFADEVAQLIVMRQAGLV